jgi:hypothetical protein
VIFTKKVVCWCLDARFSESFESVEFRGTSLKWVVFVLNHENNILPSFLLHRQKHHMLYLFSLISIIVISETLALGILYILFILKCFLSAVAFKFQLTTALLKMIPAYSQYFV